MNDFAVVGGSREPMRELTAHEIDTVGGGGLPVILWTGAKWVGGAFGAGFVGKAGADLYDHFFGDNGC